mgnify:CR=1 FL=1
MPYFKDAQECDDMLGGFFRKMSEGVASKDQVLVEIQRKLAEINLIIKMLRLFDGHTTAIVKFQNT